MPFDDYWYIVAESRELTPVRALARRVLDEWLVCFRGMDGAPTVLRDRCLHRHAPLSAGVLHNGLLSCPYHGWRYDGAGRVVDIPSLAGSDRPAHCSPPYPVIEQDGFVYVRVKRDAAAGIVPFPMPHYGEAGWLTLRLQNRFANSVANCVENFIDVPHTAFVHQGIFRSTRGQRLAATVRRSNAAVHVDYRNESDNLGSYRWFLNPRGHAIRHTDSFHAPNVTSVVYEIGARVFIITSQAVPVDDRETLVYTDLTYRFGAWNRLVAPFLRRHGQRIIDQDIEILARQGENIGRYGAQFRDTPADLIHRLVDSLRDAIARGEDPRALPAVEHEIEFCI
ncbi:MAG: Toluene-4-sulfonate monooxygenase system iron-sulfur subunit TsaM1 [Candidatus Accumulibacter phosphatis]|uniref:Toluene-4-sulfonate monooxygenase system iron-sulfur subunit TsaM1 n=1 Tax=Candidatus Accumulibacter phosphatis TaxID=327160 RepID=A0A080M8G6_9PROT|nr:aromatic ring-hydroxylating dioxygenase subunit alpha [Accumulibacter sp.]KFB73434.1 MAG: Toluene-4-sulfonate monooxygenase system iron-sulfur subunit TsaM1 [Candidatus Accumulibacter phosphatis]